NIILPEHSFPHSSYSSCPITFYSTFASHRHPIYTPKHPSPLRSLVSQDCSFVVNLVYRF
ncbi:hypothetical protein BJ944DRAFT_244381, partial [Cunninghamella echinulata]